MRGEEEVSEKWERGEMGRRTKGEGRRLESRLRSLFPSFFLESLNLFDLENISAPVLWCPMFVLPSFSLKLYNRAFFNPFSASAYFYLVGASCNILKRLKVVMNGQIQLDITPQPI